MTHQLSDYYSEGCKLAEPTNVGSGCEIPIILPPERSGLKFPGPGTAFRLTLTSGYGTSQICEVN